MKIILLNTEFFNDSIYLGNDYFKEDDYKSKFINYLQLNQSNLYFPLNGFISLMDYSMYTIFEYFDSKKGVIINYEDYPHKYDLRYKEKDLENMQKDFVKLCDQIAYGIEKYVFSTGNFIKLNYLYNLYFNFGYCKKIFLDDNYADYYYQCNNNFNASSIKISIGNLIFMENDLILTMDNYKIPLIIFGNYDYSIINLGILYTKKFQILKVNNNNILELKRYKIKYNINLPIYIIEKIPLLNNYIFNEKSLDGNDIFPIRFLHKINRDLIENLYFNMNFKNNYNLDIKIEIYIIVEDLIESLKKGILLEKFFDETITYDKLHFLISKDNIIGKMIDKEKEYYLYMIINKSQKINIKYDSLECELSIDLVYNNYIKPNCDISGMIGEDNEIQFYFLNDSLNLNLFKDNNTNDTKEIEFMEQNRLIIQISLENNLDFAIINRTSFLSLDRINYYKNSTYIETFEEYSDKIILYINIFNINLDDLMINIFTKNNKNNYNRGYKIKYYIGKLFDISYYIVPDNKKIKYEYMINDNILNLNITIPNLEKYSYGIYMGSPNTTLITKIFELELNININILKSIIFYEDYNEISSVQIFQNNDEISNITIEGIKINLDKKKYLVITYANISESNDSISYDSFLIKKENEEPDNSMSVAVIIIIIITIILLIVIILLILYRMGIFKNISNKLKKDEKNDNLLKTEIPLNTLNK